MNNYPVMWGPYVHKPINHDILDPFIKQLAGGNSNMFFIFTPKLGEDETILTNIFQVG